MKIYLRNDEIYLRNDEIYNHWLRGFPKKEIAEIFGLSRITVNGIIEKHPLLASK